VQAHEQGISGREQQKTIGCPRPFYFGMKITRQHFRRGCDKNYPWEFGLTMQQPDFVY